MLASAGLTSLAVADAGWGAQRDGAGVKYETRQASRYEQRQQQGEPQPDPFSMLALQLVPRVDQLFDCAVGHAWICLDEGCG